MRQRFMYQYYGGFDGLFQNHNRLLQARQISESNLGSSFVEVYRKGTVRNKPEVSMSYTELIAQRKLEKANGNNSPSFVRSNTHLSERTNTTIFTAAELLARPQLDLPMLAEGLIPQTGISILAGASDLGKSAWLRQLAIHIVTREERFCGFSLNPKHHNVLFLASEDDEAATSAMLHKQCRNNTGLENLRFTFNTDDILTTLNNSLSESKADLVVVDCLLDFFGTKNLNQANEVRDFLNPFKRLAAEFETQICFLHHTSKRSDEREPHKANLLGSGALEHAPRLVIELRAGEAPDTRFLCILKGNFLPPDQKAEAHELRFQDMRFASTGRRVPVETVKRSTERTPNERNELAEKIKNLSIQGISQRQIAHQLGISVSTVNDYLKRSFVRNPSEPNERTPEPETPPF